MNYVLGIDVGGTKYHLRARPLKGRDVDVVVKSLGNLNELGAQTLVKELSKHVAAVHKKMGRGAKLDGVALGASGLDGSSVVRSLSRELMKKAWWKNTDPDRRILANDIQIGMRAGTASVVSIALISGTGSNGYAVDARGDEAWVSGRGHLMADEGSGYAIGLAGLHAVRKSEDGRGPHTDICKLLFEHMNAQSTEDLMERLYDPKFGKKGVSELNQIVELAAAGGDRIAGKIHDEAAAELILMAETLHKRLHFGRDPVDTVLIGGTINKNKELLSRFLRRARRLRWMRPIPLAQDPVEGALRMLGR